MKPSLNIDRLKFMEATLRRSYITRLINEIENNLSGSAFEQFGYVISDSLYSCGELVHGGTKPSGAPTGHIVDTISPDGTFIAEYSSQADYFKKGDKIFKDTRHAYRLHKATMKKLYLMSSRACPPKMRTRLIKRAAKYKEKLNFEMHVWDARSISEHIVDNLMFNDSQITRLISFLPVLKHIRNENALNHTLPTIDPRYVKREKLEAKLTKQLRRERLLILSGLGGIGKSSIASSIAHAIKEGFDLTIWIECSHITDISALSAEKLSRFGMSVNIIGFSKVRKCLLILDNLTLQALNSHLLTGFGGDTALIITCRESRLTSGIELPLIERDCAKTIIERDMDPQCPDELLDYIYSLVGGYPLIYALFNENLESPSYDWSHVHADCDYIHQYTDNRNLLLVERLLGHLGNTLNKELGFIKSCRSKEVDIRLAENALGPIGISKLKRSAILASSQPDSIKVHDIVYELIEHKSYPIFHIAPTLASVLRECEQKDWPAFLRISFKHHDLIEYILEKDKDVALQYSYLISTNPSSYKTHLVRSTDEQYKSIVENILHRDLAIRVALLLETIETKYRHHREFADRDQAFSDLKEDLGYIDSIIDRCKNLPSELLDTIRHHQAKLLLWLNEPEAFKKAKEVFIGLAQREFPKREAQLQLARLYCKEDNGVAAVPLIEDLLSSIKKEKNGTPLTVALATYELLTRKAIKKLNTGLISQYADLISTLLKESISFGTDQSYRAFSVFAQNWSFERPDKFIEVFNCLSFPTPQSLPDDYAKASVANLYFQAGKIHEDSESVKATHCFNQSAEYYCSISNISPFNHRRYGEVLTRLGRYSEAEDVFRSLIGSDGKNPFNFFSLSKALFKQSRYNDAKIAIDSALHCLKPSNGRYRSSFLELMSDILRAMNDPSYIYYLNEALDCCDSKKYRAMLKKKLPT